MRTLNRGDFIQLMAELRPSRSYTRSVIIFKMAD